MTKPRNVEKLGRIFSTQIQKCHFLHIFTVRSIFTIYHKQTQPSTNLRRNQTVEIIGEQEMKEIIKIKAVSGIFSQMVPPINNFLHKFLCVSHLPPHLVLVDGEEAAELVGPHVGSAFGEHCEGFFDVVGRLGLGDLVFAVEKIEHFVVVTSHFVLEGVF